MANTCTTNIDVNGNEAVVEWFTDIAKNNKAEGLIEQFGSEADSMIDRIGSKWLVKTDWGKGYLAVESAWYHPDILMKNIYTQAAAIDPEVTLTGRYWDENFDPIGIFEINSSGYHTAEDSVDVDWDNEYYWDEEVEPAFDNLEL